MSSTPKKFCSNADEIRNLDGTRNVSDSESNTTDFISSLNDDCMMNIFTYLPIKDRIKIERVSKNWQRLSLWSWSSFSRLDLDSLVINKIILKKHNLNNGIYQLFYKLISKCGKYLRYIDFRDSDYKFSNSHRLDLSIILHYLINSCSNINHLIINGKTLEKPDICLGFLFSGNKNLKSVKLMRSIINGNCLRNLPFDNLETLILENIYFDLSAGLPELLLNFKNLKTLKIIKTNWKHQQTDFLDYEIIINAPNITELVVLLNKRKTYIDVKGLISKAKKLKTIVLDDFEIDSQNIKSFFNDSIEKLVLNDCKVSSNNLINILKSLYKLTTLGLKNFMISRIILESIINYCQNLTFLQITLKNSIDVSLTIDCQIFQKLSKLETLDLSYSDIDDTILKRLSEHCKNLKAINLNFCNKITDTGLSFITSLPKLEIFHIKCLYKVTGSSLKFIPNIKELHCFNTCKANIKNDQCKSSEGLCELLKNSKHLEKLDISFCDNKILNEVIHMAINTIDKRDKNIILKIIYSDKNFFKSYFKMTPFVAAIDLIYISQYTFNFYPFY